MSVSVALRQSVANESRRRCGYCQTQELVSGIPLTIEHIIPKARGGSDEQENLWLSCRLCNEAKGIQTQAVDPQTLRTVPLYNPRTENWSSHFQWDESLARIVGLTAVGRATIEALNLNSELRVFARMLWVEASYHPPIDE